MVEQVCPEDARGHALAPELRRLLALDRHEHEIRGHERARRVYRWLVRQVPAWPPQSIPHAQPSSGTISPAPPIPTSPSAFAMSIPTTSACSSSRACSACATAKSREKPEPLTPSQIGEISVDCWSTSQIFSTGHRIRVTITSSNVPRFDIPPPAPPSLGRNRRKGQANQPHPLRHQASSRIILPVVE